VTGRLYLIGVGALMGVTALLGLSAAPAAFAAGARIGQNQLFYGSVDHHHPTATISMACFGPVRPLQTGHPFAGQTISVAPSVDSVPDGFTGSKADRIEVVFATPASTINPRLVFFHFGTRPLPTSLTLPCSGSGVVSFVPLPSSPTARADSVRVSFAGQP